MMSAAGFSRLNGVVTLLTDFGWADGTVAAMKGVLLDLAPGARVVDAGHDIPPQDIRAGAWALAQYAPFFPPGTLHIAVIDPGVGTGRRILWVEIGSRHYLVPDNGLLSWVLYEAPATAAYALRPDCARIHPPSATFHGRDVFAWAAGLALSGRAKRKDLADPVEAPRLADWTRPRLFEKRAEGEIIHIDHFGNLITNLDRRDCPENGGIERIQLASRSIQAVQRTYAEGVPGELMALWGSTGKLELAVPNGSAKRLVQAQTGMPVSVEFFTPEQTGA